MIEFIGNGGHAAVICDLIAVRKRLAILGGVPDGTIVAVGNNRHRQREVLSRENTRYATLIHPSATVAANAVIGAGTVIMAGVVVQTRAVIGEHCILNTGCTVDHDCVLSDFVHVAPGAHLCGGVHVGVGALIGVGVGIEPGVAIPAWSVVKRLPYVMEPAK